MANVETQNNIPNNSTASANIFPEKEVNRPSSQSASSDEFMLVDDALEMHLQPLEATEQCKNLFSAEDFELFITDGECKWESDETTDICEYIVAPMDIIEELDSTHLYTPMDEELIVAKIRNAMSYGRLTDVQEAFANKTFWCGVESVKSDINRIDTYNSLDGNIDAYALLVDAVTRANGYEESYKESIRAILKANTAELDVTIFDDSELFERIMMKTWKRIKYAHDVSGVALSRFLRGEFNKYDLAIAYAVEKTDKSIYQIIDGIKEQYATNRSTKHKSIIPNRLIEYNADAFDSKVSHALTNNHNLSNADITALANIFLSAGEDKIAHRLTEYNAAKVSHALTNNHNLSNGDITALAYIFLSAGEDNIAQGLCDGRKIEGLICDGARGVYASQDEFVHLDRVDALNEHIISNIRAEIMEWKVITSD